MRVALACAAAGVLLASLAGLPRADDLVLVKIDREQPVVVASDALDEAAGLQELTSGWLAEASSGLVSRLQSAGLLVTILDQAPAGKHYFFVFGVGPADLAALRAIGPTFALESSVALVASPDDQLLPRLPGHLSPAPLSLSPASLVRPVFDLKGHPSAALRVRPSYAASVDTRISQAVASVSRDRLAATVRDLEAFGTRYASTTSAAAAGNYLYDRSRQLGLQVQYDDFTFTSAAYPATNIVVTIPGRTSPNDIVILCAHYDSTSTTAERATQAPGADDNASGTAAVLEAARVLAATPLDFTVKLIAFSAEEWGLYGSQHYAQAARARGDRIVAVLNLDMIGYADVMPEDLDVAANPSSEWLVDRFAATSAAYGGPPVVKIVSATARSSDHAPFWDQGYDAVMCIEDIPLTNPYYHKVTDRFQTLNLTFLEQAARGAVAVLADLAQPAGTVGVPTSVALHSETLRSLFSRTKSNVLQWTAVPSAAGYHVYRAVTSHGTYRRLNASPLSSTTYTDAYLSQTAALYYVVTAVDAQGRESNHSVEVAAR